MSAKRKALSKKTRFEVFKRDGFICQYCGGTPPNVLLWVDHIIPVAEGGGNEMDNLITSCQPCNSGKGARSLTNIPKSLKDRAAEIAEQEAQIKGYAKIIKAKTDRIEEESWDIAAALENREYLDEYPRDRLRSIRHFLTVLPYHEVLEAAEITSSRWGYIGASQFKYFCGICWKKLRDRSGIA